MANQTVTTSQTLEQAISLGMENGNNLTINSGAVVTCTQTPSILIGSIFINYGEFHIDGINITSGNAINFVGEGGLINSSNDMAISVLGQGKLNITGDWLDIGTTNGTNNQTFDLSTATGIGYWNKDGVDFCVDFIPMIQVETGRRIDYDNVTGITPEIGDWIYLTSDRTVMGKVKSLGTNYLVVWVLSGSLSNNDEIHCRKVVDNMGPDMQITWTANVNNVNGDILESGVYTEFGNCRSNGNNHMSDFGTGLGGLIFHNAFESTDLTMGGSTGGFLPPSGCKVRVPNVHITSSGLIDDAGTGTPYADGKVLGSNNSNESEWYALEFSAGGEIDFSICNWGTAYTQDSGASKFNTEYCGFTVGFGSNICGSTVNHNHNVVVQAPEIDAAVGIGAYGGIQDTVNGAEITFCMNVAPRIAKTNYFGGTTSINVNVSDCIFTTAGGGTDQATAGEGYSFTTVTNGSIDNCLYFGGKPNSNVGFVAYATTSKNINITNFKMSCTQDYTSQTNDLDSLVLQNSSECSIIGVDQISGGSPGGNFVRISDMSDSKVRAIGMIDDRIDLGTHGRLGVEISGLCNNIDIARCWFDKSTTVVEEFISVIVTAKNVLVQNCASKYLAEVQISGTNTAFHGISGGGGAVSSSTGWEDALVGSYGRNIHDTFESDTTGSVACLMITPSADVNNTTIISGNPLFYKDGDLDMVSGDVIEFEQDYFMKGHTGFTGVYTAATGGATRGANEWSNITLDFQYQFDGGSWNGSWLDVRTPANLTGITGDIEGGIKFKFRFTATGTQTSMSMLIINTTTTLADQAANYYPIDQTETNFILSNVIVGSRYWIYNVDTSTTLTTGIAISSTVEYTGTNIPNGTNIMIRVRNASGNPVYKPFETNAVVASLSVTSWVSQILDQ